MIAIIIFWTLILVSLKLLAMIVVDAFRPLPKPAAKRKPRKSPFLDPLSVTVMAIAKGRGAEDLRRQEWNPWGCVPTPPPALVSEMLTPNECLVATRLHRKREAFLGHSIQDHYYHNARAYMALAKMLDMPLKKCMSESDPRCHSLFAWNGMSFSLAIASGSSKYLATQFAYFSDRADHYLWLVPMNRDFTGWQVRGAMSDRDFSSLFERGLIRVTSSGYTQVPKKLFNNPRAWYSQVLSLGVNK